MGDTRKALALAHSMTQNVMTEQTPEVLRARITELETALREVTEQASRRRVIIHRIRSPLTVIVGFAETLATRAAAGEISRERLHDRLVRINEAARKIDAMLDELGP